jgi:hypothetical protein
MVPSLGRIGFFKGKMITLCGRVTNVHVIIHGTSTEEEFEVINFVENNAPFPLLLGKTWIEKDHIRRKAEEESTKNKNQELTAWMILGAKFRSWANFPLFFPKNEIHYFKNDSPKFYGIKLFYLKNRQNFIKTI